MKKNRFYLFAGFLGLIVTTLAVSGMASAFQGDPNITGPRFDQENHESMMEALDNSDYQAWTDLRQGRGKMAEIINEDNFDQFVTMHKLMQEGNFDEAEVIREELGLPGRPQGEPGAFNKGFRMGMRAGDCTFEAK